MNDRDPPQPASDDAAASNGVIQITKDANGKFTAEFVWRAKKATSSFVLYAVAANE